MRKIIAAIVTAAAMAIAFAAPAVAGVIHHRHPVISAVSGGAVLTTPDLLSAGSVLSLVGYAPGTYSVVSEVPDGPVYQVRVAPALPAWLDGDNVDFVLVSP